MHYKYKWVHSIIFGSNYHLLFSNSSFGTVSIDNGNRDDVFHVWDDADNLVDHIFDLSNLLCDVGYVPNPDPVCFHAPVYYLLNQNQDIEIKVKFMQPIQDTRVPSCANPTTSSENASTSTAPFVLLIRELCNLWDVPHYLQHFGGLLLGVQVLGIIKLVLHPDVQFCMHVNAPVPLLLVSIVHS